VFETIKPERSRQISTSFLSTMMLSYVPYALYTIQFFLCNYTTSTDRNSLLQSQSSLTSVYYIVGQGVYDLEIGCCKSIYSYQWR